MALLVAPWLHERVTERVEAPVMVGDPLAIEQPAQEPDRLVEPVEPLAEPGAPGLVEPERVVEMKERSRRFVERRKTNVQVDARRRRPDERAPGDTTAIVDWCRASAA